MSKTEKANSVIIENANQFDKIVLKHNVLIAMTGDHDILKAGREYSSWYIVKKNDKFITYFEKRDKPTIGKVEQYWPITLPMKVTKTIKEAVDYLHKFGCEKFYIVKNYQSSDVMDYTTVITKI